MACRAALLLATITLVTGCAHNATSVPGNAATVSPARVTPPPIATVSSRAQALSDACTVVRAIDGRAVCREALAGHADESPRVPTQAGPAAVAPDERNYVVIGSFVARSNAREWAAYNADFGASVQAVELSGQPRYRVLVGPVAAESVEMTRALMGAVGIEGSWTMAVCSDCPDSAGHARPRLAALDHAP